MDVIDLDQRRREAEGPDPEYATCPCGEAWFELCATPDKPGAVCMTPAGSITGYAGTPHCIGCGERYAGAAPSARKGR
ncbi:hypothetical protein ABZ684_05120 [Streptomyces sp. NPDC006995]|uniref:hypothetical protein n=1 Tax=Streptomyces sp. NPDC006995 TaxID=3156907 RepID=UPI0033F6C8F3